MKIKTKIWRSIKGLVGKKVDGIGIVEVILILVILIGLVLLFKTQITGVINKAFKAISDNSKTIIG